MSYLARDQGFRTQISEIAVHKFFMQKPKLTGSNTFFFYNLHRSDTLPICPFVVMAIAKEYLTLILGLRTAASSNQTKGRQAYATVLHAFEDSVVPRQMRCNMAIGYECHLVAKAMSKASAKPDTSNKT